MKLVSEKKKLGLSEKIMIGLALGLATGLFFGEMAGPLKYAGDAFIGLLFGALQLNLQVPAQ